MTEAIETKKHDSIVYRYYDYLKANHYGKENGIKRDVLAKIFNVTIAVQKEILREINEASDLPKLISTSGKIYMCRTEHECEVAAYNEFNSGLTRLKKGKKMLEKMSLNGQMKMKLGKYYKEAVECFEVDEEKK